jgi:hypothetical protein
MARAWSTPRTVCIDCGEKLTSSDDGRDQCLLCRVARAKGPAALSRRYKLVTRLRRAREGPPAPVSEEDIFKRFK